MNPATGSGSIYLELETLWHRYEVKILLSTDFLAETPNTGIANIKQKATIADIYFSHTNKNSILEIAIKSNAD